MTRYRLRLQGAPRYWTGREWSDQIDTAVRYATIGEAYMAAMMRQFRKDWCVEAESGEESHENPKNTRWVRLVVIHAL